MVCDRCILIVKQQLKQLDLNVEEISLGKVKVYPDPDEVQLQQLSIAFSNLGFELIYSWKEQFIERIKTIIIEMVHYSDLSQLTESISSRLAESLHKDYTYLSRLFSEAEGYTIEKYIIQQKTEKIKELLEYGEFNINEIAYRMGYSSSAHLSTQFKSMTGLTPSQYRTEPAVTRKALDQLN